MRDNYTNVEALPTTEPPKYIWRPSSAWLLMKRRKEIKKESSSVKLKAFATTLNDETDGLKWRGKWFQSHMVRGKRQCVEGIWIKVMLYEPKWLDEVPRDSDIWVHILPQKSKFPLSFLLFHCSYSSNHWIAIYQHNPHVIWCFMIIIITIMYAGPFGVHHYTSFIHCSREINLGTYKYFCQMLYSDIWWPKSAVRQK